MEGSPTQTKQESINTQEEVPELKLQKTSHSSWKKTLLLIGGLILILIISFFLYLLKFNNKNSTSVTQKNISTKSVPSAVLPTKLEKTLPKFVTIPQPTNLVFHDQFQELIAKNCKEVYTTPKAFTYFISLASLPITLNQSSIQLDKNNPDNNPPYNTPSCIGQLNSDYVMIDLADKRSLYIYDQYSQELGHGGYSFFLPIPFATTIFDKDNITLSFILKEGMGTVIGQEPIAIRAIKTITLPNGNRLFVTLDTIAIDEKDPRLTNILNKYAIPSQFQVGGFETDSTKATQYIQEIKNTFFTDMNNLNEPEEDRITNLLTILSAISVK